MAKIKLPVFFFLVLACLTFAPGAWAQTGAKSPTQCDKLGPRTWKGSMEEMRFQEAVYWGCRMDVPAETVMECSSAWFLPCAESRRVPAVSVLLGTRATVGQRSGKTMARGTA